MKGRNRLHVFLLIFVTCIILIPIFIPPILADDQIGLSFNPIPNQPPRKAINPDPFNGSVDIVVLQLTYISIMHQMTHLLEWIMMYLVIGQLHQLSGMNQ